MTRVDANVTTVAMSCHVYDWMQPAIVLNSAQHFQRSERTPQRRLPQYVCVDTGHLAGMGALIEGMQLARGGHA